MKKIILLVLGALVLTLTINTLNSCKSNKKQEIPAKEAAYKCPMHPEVTSDKPGTCSKCGMELEKQEKKKLKAVYTCPMHPEVISDKAGTCSKCGMELEIKQDKSVYFCPGNCEYVCNTAGKCPNCNKTLIKRANSDAHLSSNSHIDIKHANVNPASDLHYN